MWGIHTGWMCCLKDPVGVFRISDGLIVPFDLQMARGFLEEGRAGEGVHVQLWFWWHSRWRNDTVDY